MVALRCSTFGIFLLVFRAWNVAPLVLPTVTSSEENRALNNLMRLLAGDLDEAERVELVQGIKDAELTGDRFPEWSGRLLAALHRRGATWAEIAVLTGVSQTTAFRRATPYI